MSDRLDQLLTEDGEAWRTGLAPARSVHGRLDDRPTPANRRTALAVAAGVAAVAAIVAGVTLFTGAGHRTSPPAASKHTTLAALTKNAPCPIPPHAPRASRAQLASFRAVAVLDCRFTSRDYPGDGEWSVLIRQASRTGINDIVRAFDQPDQPRPPNILCTAERDISPAISLVDSRGRYLIPRFPLGICGKPIEIAAITHQVWTTISVRKVRQEASEAAVAAHCDPAFKNLINFDAHSGVSATSGPGGPVLTTHPNAPLKACIYRSTTSDLDVGAFVRATTLSQTASAKLRAALVHPGPSRATSCAPQRDFAVISAARNGEYVSVELGGCWRVVRDGITNLGTADAATVRDLLHIP